MINTLTWNDFMKFEIRVGTILTAQIFEKAKIPAYKLSIDFGEFGILKSSAQITDLYKPDDIIGKQIVAVTNFPPKQIANFMSECLVLGAVPENKEIVLLFPGQVLKNGTGIG